MDYRHIKWLIIGKQQNRLSPEVMEMHSRSNMFMSMLLNEDKSNQIVDPGYSWIAPSNERFCQT